MAVGEIRTFMVATLSPEANGIGLEDASLLVSLFHAVRHRYVQHLHGNPRFDEDKAWV